MNEKLMALLNGVELQNELNVFARKILEDEGINENADDVAKFIIEVITARATNGKMRMVGISDATMAKLVKSTVKYLPDWRAEKARPKAETPKAEPKVEPKKETKPVTKPTPKKAETKNDFDLESIKVSDTAKKFVQMEIEFDIL